MRSAPQISAWPLHSTGTSPRHNRHTSAAASTSVALQRQRVPRVSMRTHAAIKHAVQHARAPASTQPLP